MERAIFDAHWLRRLLRRAYPFILHLPGNEALISEIEREIADFEGSPPRCGRLTLETLPQKLADHGVTTFRPATPERPDRTLADA